MTSHRRKTMRRPLTSARSRAIKRNMRMRGINLQRIPLSMYSKSARFIKKHPIAIGEAALSGVVLLAGLLFRTKLQRLFARRYW